MYIEYHSPEFNLFFLYSFTLQPMFRYLVLFVFIGKNVSSTASGSVLEDEVLGLQGALDRQILFLADLQARQGQVIELFQRIAKAFPRPEVAHVKTVESNAVSKLRQKVQERKQALAETTLVPVSVEPTLDDLSSLLIRETAYISIRATSIQTWLGLLAERSGVVQDIAGGLQVLRTCQTILGFLQERVHSSNALLQLLPALRGVSKKKRDPLNGPIAEYRKDAETDVAAQTAIRDAVSSAVRALVQKERHLKSLDEQEVQQILESFEIVDPTELDYEAVVVTMEEIEAFEGILPVVDDDSGFDLCDFGESSELC
jgi:hypothetical protein